MANASLNKDVLKMLSKVGDPQEILTLFDEKHPSTSNPRLFESLVFQALDLHDDFITYLLEDTNKRRLTAKVLQMLLCASVQKDDASRVDILLSHGATADQDGPIHTPKGKVMTTPLRCAIAEDNLNMLDKLLTQCNFQTQQSDERKAIHMAFLHDSPRCLEYILTNPKTLADINVLDKRGQTPLRIAAARCPGLIPRLVALGADSQIDKPRYSGTHKNILYVLSSSQLEEAQDGHNYKDLSQKLIGDRNNFFGAKNMRESVLCALCDHVKHRFMDTYANANQAGGENLREEISILVLGCELKDCIDYISSISPNTEVEFGIRGAIDQIFHVMNLRQIPQEKVNGYILYIPFILQYILEIIQIMFRYNQAYDIEGISAVDNIVRTLLTMERSNEMFLKDDANRETYYKHVLGSVLKIMKALLNFDGHRCLNERVKLVELLVYDRRGYSVFLDVYLENLSEPQRVGFVDELVQAVNKIRDKDQNKQNEIRNYILTKK